MMIMPQKHHSPAWYVKDINVLNAPLMICGGVYGNLEAFEALIEKADSLSIPAENIIHTGDIIACCADPMATIELMVGCNIHAIQGNVENCLVNRGRTFDISKKDSVVSSQWYKFLDRTLNDEHRRYIAKLPHQLTFKCEGKTVRVVHGSVSSINEYIYASDPSHVFKQQFEQANADIVISGHSGIPFTRKFGKRVWHNSGGLGLPANDGTHRVWYSLAVPDSTYGLHFEHHWLSYDYKKAQEKMRLHKLPGRFADTLVTGLWPSQDRLPEFERSRAGKPLDPAKLVIVDSGFTKKNDSSDHVAPA